MKENIIEEQEKLRIFKVTDLNHIKNLRKGYKLPIEVRLKKIKDQEGFKIYLVDGCKIRHFVDFDFTMGGHGFRYVYVPLDEVWIDNSNKSETAEIIAHEIHEAKLMRDGVDYANAHNQASLVEFELRNKEIILPVGHFLQKHWWSCGPAALKIVLDYYKEKFSFSEIIKGTNPDNRSEADLTLHKDFARYLEKLKYEYHEQSNSKIEDIEEAIQKGLPVIVDYQDHHFKPGGHFAVIVGYDEKRFKFSNPSLKKKYEWIDKNIFEKDWWEEDEPSKIVQKWMFVIYPKNF